MAADLIEHLVGPPGFLGADDRGAGPRAAARHQRQPAQPRVLREVFRGLPGRRPAESRRSPRPRNRNSVRAGSRPSSRGPHVIDRHAPRLPRAVQGADIAVELLAAPFHPLQLRAVIRGAARSGWRPAPARSSGRTPAARPRRHAGPAPARRGSAGARRLVTASIAARFSATNSTFLPRAISDAIRFAIVWLLPVPGGPLTIRLCPRQHRVDRVVLARVGIQHQELIRQRHLIRARDRPRPRSLAADRRAGLLIARQRRDQLMRDQLIQRPVQITDHRELGIGEIRQHNPLIDPETRYLPGLLADPLIGLLQLPQLIDPAVRAAPASAA